MATLLDMPLRDVEQIVYFNAYVVLNPGIETEVDGVVVSVNSREIRIRGIDGVERAHLLHPKHVPTVHENQVVEAGEAIASSYNLSYKQLLTEDQWIDLEDQIYAEDPVSVS